MKSSAGKHCLLSHITLSSLFQIGEGENLNELLKVADGAQLVGALLTMHIELQSLKYFTFVGNRENIFLIMWFKQMFKKVEMHICLSFIS